MYKEKLMRSVFCGLGVVVFLFAVSSAAIAADKLVLSNSVFQEVEVTNADGKKEIKQVPVSTAFPQSELIYVITYKNTGDKPAEDVVINNPIAKELVYKDQSGKGANAVLSVSVDGGKNYCDLPVLRIPTKQGADRPAQVTDITDLQFKLKKQVQPQEEGTVSFRAVLK
jgi:uncharacterized repeat protein (TIGR01451 family)